MRSMTEILYTADTLKLAGEVVPLAVIARWTDDESRTAREYARREWLRQGKEDLLDPLPRPAWMPAKAVCPAHEG